MAKTKNHEQGPAISSDNHEAESEAAELIAINQRLADQIEAERALNQQLIDINNAVTPLRTRDQVIKIIERQLKELIDFQSFYITVYKNELRNGKIIVDGLHPELLKQKEVKEFIKSHWKHEEQVRPDKNTPEPLSEDYLIYLTTSSFQYKDLPETLFVNYPLAKAEKEMGFKSGLIVPLRVEGKNIGPIILSSFKPDEFPENVFPLLEKICSVVAIGVSNMLLHEEMLEAKAEIEVLNQQLQDINNAVTPFRTRKQIMAIIGEQLKKIVPIDSYYITQNTNFIRKGNRFSKFFLLTEGMDKRILEDAEVVDYINKGEHEAYDPIDGHNLHDGEYEKMPILAFNLH